MAEVNLLADELAGLIQNMYKAVTFLSVELQGLLWLCFKTSKVYLWTFYIAEK